MNIGEAVEALKQGKTNPAASGRAVSRAAWAPGVVFERSEDGRFFLRTRDGFEVPYTPSDEDWAADDWKLGGPTT